MISRFGDKIYLLTKKSVGLMTKWEEKRNGRENEGGKGRGRAGEQERRGKRTRRDLT